MCIYTHQHHSIEASIDIYTHLSIIYTKLARRVMKSLSAFQTICGSAHVPNIFHRQYTIYNSSLPHISAYIYIYRYSPIYIRFDKLRQIKLVSFRFSSSLFLSAMRGASLKDENVIAVRERFTARQFQRVSQRSQR